MKPSSVRKALAAGALSCSLSACAAITDADPETVGATAQSTPRSAAPRSDAPAQPSGPLITNARQLTFEGLRAGEGYFSADGSAMIFQSEREPDQGPAQLNPTH